MKYNEILIHPMKGDRYKVMREIHYKDIVVPIGFKTNGANVPRFAWNLYPPNKSDYMPAVIVHDYLCEMEDYKKADQYFKEIMQELGVNKITTGIFYNAVRLYHLFK